MESDIGAIRGEAVDFGTGLVGSKGGVSRRRENPV